MNSMTGFGKAELTTKAGKFIVEIASVNNRFLEISARLPRQFFILEPKVRDLVAQKVSRGKINLYVGFEESDNSPSKYTINRTAAKAYYKQLLDLKAELGMDDTVTVKDLLSLPDLTRADDESIDDNVIWPELMKVTEIALANLVAMRNKEGAGMAKDMKKRLTVLKRQTKRISKLSVSAVERYGERLNDRLTELLNSPLPDSLRIEEQIAMMADKSDISEECTRFLIHLEQYGTTLMQNEPAGKKLNFILQEMNREANTIASKSIDAEISSIVITLKEEIEKLREMVQNVE